MAKAKSKLPHGTEARRRLAERYTREFLRRNFARVEVSEASRIPGMGFTVTEFLEGFPVIMFRIRRDTAYSILLSVFEGEATLEQILHPKGRVSRPSVDGKLTSILETLDTIIREESHA